MRTITDEWSGEVPSDLSEQASEQRRLARHTHCQALDVPEEWTHSSVATLDEKVARIATVQGEHAEFAKSLAEQYAKKGTLSQKQLVWVARLYSKYADKNYWLRQALLSHSWQRVGSITHHYNTVLGTFSATDYHRCSKCGVSGETREGNNYSGD